MDVMQAFEILGSVADWIMAICAIAALVKIQEPATNYYYMYMVNKLNTAVKFAEMEEDRGRLPDQGGFTGPRKPRYSENVENLRNKRDMYMTKLTSRL